MTIAFNSYNVISRQNSIITGSLLHVNYMHWNPETESLKLTFLASFAFYERV